MHYGPCMEEAELLPSNLILLRSCTIAAMQAETWSDSISLHSFSESTRRLQDSLQDPMSHECLCRHKAEAWEELVTRLDHRVQGLREALLVGILALTSLDHRMSALRLAMVQIQR